MPKKKKKQCEFNEPVEIEGAVEIDVAEKLFARSGHEADKLDVAFLNIVLVEIGDLLAANWPRIRLACNENGEGEIVVGSKVCLPFGKQTQEQEISTEISFGVKKIKDERKRKVGDPDQLKLLALE